MLLASFHTVLVILIVSPVIFIGGGIFVGAKLKERYGHSAHYRPLELKWRKSGDDWRRQELVAIDYRGSHEKLATMNVVELRPGIALITYQPTGSPTLQAIFYDDETVVDTAGKTAQAAKELRPRKFNYQTVLFSTDVPSLKSQAQDAEGYQGVALFQHGPATVSLYWSEANTNWILVWEVKGATPRFTYLIEANDVIVAANLAIRCMFNGGHPHGDLWDI